MIKDYHFHITRIIETSSINTQSLADTHYGAICAKGLHYLATASTEDTYRLILIPEDFTIDTEIFIQPPATLISFDRAAVNTFHPSLLRELVGQPFAYPLNVATPNSADLLLATTAALEMNRKTLDEGRKEREKALVWAVFSTIFGQVSNRGRLPLSKKGINEQVAAFVELVENNYYREHKLDFYAGELYLTIAKLRRIAQEDLQTSPLQYLQQRILIAAREKLRNTQLPISQVAEDLGFDDPAYFTRLFRKKTGITPVQFRNLVAKK